MLLNFTVLAKSLRIYCEYYNILLSPPNYKK